MIGRIDEGEIDLAEVLDWFHAEVSPEAREGFVDGRTAFRDVVAAHLGCSMLDAEEMVDTLVARGYLRFEKDPERELPDRWVVEELR